MFGHFCIIVDERVRKGFLLKLKTQVRKKMEKNETYFVARLLKKGEFLSSEIFESLEEARLWAMKEAKLLISDLEMLRMTNVGDICVEIDKHFFGYEISSEELLRNSERVL